MECDYRPQGENWSLKEIGTEDAMRLPRASYDEFRRHFERVERELADERRARQFLDEACADPIVEGLLKAIPIIAVDNQGRSKLSRFDTIRRDLLVILALRSLEREQWQERLQLRFEFN